MHGRSLRIQLDQKLYSRLPEPGMQKRSLWSSLVPLPFLSHHVLDNSRYFFNQPHLRGHFSFLYYFKMVFRFHELYVRTIRYVGIRGFHKIVPID